MQKNTQHHRTTKTTLLTTRRQLNFVVNKDGQRSLRSQSLVRSTKPNHLAASSSNYTVQSFIARRFSSDFFCSDIVRLEIIIIIKFELLADVHSIHSLHDIHHMIIFNLNFRKKIEIVAGTVVVFDDFSLNPNLLEKLSTNLLLNRRSRRQSDSKTS